MTRALHITLLVVWAASESLVEQRPEAFPNELPAEKPDWPLGFPMFSHPAMPRFHFQRDRPHTPENAQDTPF
jgi:hypothetical protein